jgi:hypothetical protein
MRVAAIRPPNRLSSSIRPPGPQRGVRPEQRVRAIAALNRETALSLEGRANGVRANRIHPRLREIVRLSSVATSHELYPQSCTAKTTQGHALTQSQKPQRKILKRGRSPNLPRTVTNVIAWPHRPPRNCSEMLEAGLGPACRRFRPVVTASRQRSPIEPSCRTMSKDIASGSDLFRRITDVQQNSFEVVARRVGFATPRATNVPQSVRYRTLAQLFDGKGVASVSAAPMR